MKDSTDSLVSSSAHNRPLPHNETGWRPLRKGQCVFGKINGNWFQVKVVSVTDEIVRVKLTGDCDRELPRSSIMTWAESQGRPQRIAVNADHDSTTPVPKEAEEWLAEIYDERDRLQDLHDAEELAWSEQDELQKRTDG